VRSDRLAVGQQLAGVVEQHDPVAQQGLAVLRVRDHDQRRVAVAGGRAGTTGMVLARVC